MSLLVVLTVAALAVVLALGMAYLPMRILMTQIAKGVTAPIQDFLQRQRDRRDRRDLARNTPDRRKT